MPRSHGLKPFQKRALAALEASPSRKLWVWMIEDLAEEANMRVNVAHAIVYGLARLGILDRTDLRNGSHMFQQHLFYYEKVANPQPYKSRVIS